MAWVIQSDTTMRLMFASCLAGAAGAAQHSSSTIYASDHPKRHPGAAAWQALQFFWSLACGHVPLRLAALFQNFQKNYQSYQACKLRQCSPGFV